MTRTSFAGVLSRAMRASEPPLTARDVAVLADGVGEADVEDLLAGGRRPTLAEVAAISEALAVPMGDLLAGQRSTRGGRDE